jgi:lipoyl(octanoyl) transferase
VLLDHPGRPIDYEQGWQLQKECLGHVQQFAAAGQLGHDYLIILQHNPVYTLGAGSSEEHVKFDLRRPPLPVHRVERGGEVTYHGPGQLVLYPVLDLQHHRKDLHWYMRSLEEVAIRALSAVSDLDGQRVPGLTGVWVDGCKVAAIGVRAQRWVTYHGMSLNVDMDLAPFDMIVPCGISDRRVTTVSEQERAQPGRSHEHQTASLVEEYRFALLESFCEVFGVEMIAHSDNTGVETIAGLASSTYV